MPSAPTISFDVKPSRLLMAAVEGMTLVALAAIVLSRLPWMIKAALCVATVLYAGINVRKLRRQPLRTVGWHADDSWTLHLVDDREATGRLLSGRVLGPLIVLRLAWPDGGRSVVTLLPDSADADTRRRLRMRLSALSDNA